MKSKYFKTFHFPWTMSSTADDKILTDAEVKRDFYPMQDAVASIKMDGENTTIGREKDGVYSHARSIDSKSHWSRNHIKQLADRIALDIPLGWRICGENMMAVHSIKYTDLESYFYVFSIWDENNLCLSYDEMVEFCAILDLSVAPLLFRGKFVDMVPQFSNHFGLDFTKDEGYVVSNARQFHFSQAQKNVAKVVRKDHVQTDEHWSKGTERNELK